VKFSNLLFPESKNPDGDFEVIEESLAEAVLSEELGYDAVVRGDHFPRLFVPVPRSR